MITDARHKFENWQGTKAKSAILSVTFGSILICDQITKQWVHSKFHWGESLRIIPDFFSLTYVRNQGAAFGFLHRTPEWFRTPFFLVMPIAVMIFILFLFFRVAPKQRHWRLNAFGYSLILSGAIGNLIDRVRFGYVIDFLDFHWKEIYHYPAFNVADSAIVVGVSLLLLLSFFDERHRKIRTNT